MLGMQPGDTTSYDEGPLYEFAYPTASNLKEVTNEYKISGINYFQRGNAAEYCAITVSMNNGEVSPMLGYNMRHVYPLQIEYPNDVKILKVVALFV